MRSRATCLHCGADVEALGFCGVCGTSLRDSPPSAPRSDVSRMERARRFTRSSGFTIAVAVAGLAILVALLADAPGLALLIAAFVVPVLIVLRLMRVDVFEREPIRVWVLVGAAGFIAGVAIAIGDAYTIERFWFAGSEFNAGAAGFAGSVAAGEGAPPITVLVLSGIILPLIGLALQFVLPLLLRRFPPLHNEVVDGVILGASAGGGFVAATSVVYFWPLVNGSVGGIGVAEMTAMIIGVIVLRPILFCLIPALIGAGVWRSALSQRPSDLVVPITGGLAALFLYAIVDRLLMPYGAHAELGWLALITVALVVLGRRELHRAVRFDRERLMTDRGRVVCPHCQSVTPAGAFCAACGQPFNLQRDQAQLSEPVPS